MKVVVEREGFLAVFQMAAAVAPNRSPRAILENVKFEVTSGTSVLVATDTEVGIRAEVAGVEVETPGVVILPAGEFGNILRESTDEKLSITVKDQETIVEGEHSKFQLSNVDPEEFPDVVEFTASSYLELPAAVLKELIRRTVFATDNESSRYALGGVMLELNGETLVAVGTDGRRLAKMEGAATQVGEGGFGDAAVIVPSRSMGLIEKACNDPEEVVRISSSDNSVLVKTAATTIFSRLVEGRFPKWKDVFPKRGDAIQIDIATGPLYSALRQAAIVSRDESRGVDFHFANGTVVLSGMTAEVGESRVELPVAYQGDPLTISLDHRFVEDFLRVLSSDMTFNLEVENSDAAALFTTTDGFAYVVMPLARDGQAS